MTNTTIQPEEGLQQQEKNPDNKNTTTTTSQNACLEVTTSVVSRDKSTNRYGRVCPKNGASYSLEQKQEVANVVTELANKNGGLDKVKVSHVAKHAKVSAQVARKVKEELMKYGGLIDPTSIRKVGQAKRNYPNGSRSINEQDEIILKALRNEWPERTIKSYREELICATGTVVDETTIAKFFKKLKQKEIQEKNEEDRYKRELVAKFIETNKRKKMMMEKRHDIMGYEKMKKDDDDDEKKFAEQIAPAMAEAEVLLSKTGDSVNHDSLEALAKWKVGL